MLRLPPTPTLFPYTTLFRSVVQRVVLLSQIIIDQFGERELPGEHGGGRFHSRVHPHHERLAIRLAVGREFHGVPARRQDRKSTRLNSSHVAISYAVFCLKKK